jgi:hypothetical protein
MALALLTATAAAAAGFGLAGYYGFVLAAHGMHDPHIRELVSRHVLAAIPAMLLSLFSQSMVIFYFIGTGRLVKDEIAGYSPERRDAILRALRRFKARTSPAATFAMLSAIFVFVVGGWTHTTPRAVSSVPHWTHLGAAALAFALHLWALRVEIPAFAENHRLMADPSGYAAAARPAAP